jgi:hypothetical protein
MDANGAQKGIETIEGAVARGLRRPISVEAQENARRERAPGAPHIPLVHSPIWERQPRESPRAFEAFALYRDLGPERTMANTGRKIGRGYKAMAKYADRWSWNKRALAWDRMRDQAKSEAAIAEAKAVGERHARIAGQHIAALLTPVSELARRLNARIIDLSKISDSDVIKMVQRNGPVIRQLAELERLSVGLPTTTASQVGASGVGPVPTPSGTTVVDALRSILAVEDDAG